MFKKFKKTLTSLLFGISLSLGPNLDYKINIPAVTQYANPTFNCNENHNEYLARFKLRYKGNDSFTAQFMVKLAETFLGDYKNDYYLLGLWNHRFQYLDAFIDLVNVNSFSKKDKKNLDEICNFVKNDYYATLFYGQQIKKLLRRLK